MTIAQRLSRRAPEDISLIGGMIANVMKGDFWQVLTFLTASQRVMEIEKSKTGVGGNLSAERILGRIEAYETVISDLEAIVQMKEELDRPRAKKKESAEDTAEEIVDTEDIVAPLNYGGAV